MIQRLCTTYMEPDELRKMIGDEAYFAAKALEELDRENDRLAKLKNAYLMEFGHEIREERAAARMKFFKAYENWSIEKRALLKENAQLQQAHEQELEKAREAEKNKQLLIAEKEKQKVLLKSEKEKQKVLLRGKEKQEKLLNLLKEKEKQELLLKAEKEKQELLKAEKEKQELFQFKMVQTMLKLGNSVEMIADLLEISVAQVQDWSKDFKK